MRQGKALYVGISSYNARRTREAAAILRRLGTPCLIHQPSYSLVNRWIETDGLLDVLADEGIGAIVFSPLAQGLLTDKYLKGIPADSRAAEAHFFKPDFLTPETLARVRALNDIARRRGQSLAQMALAWALRDKRVTSALIGASRPEQVDRQRQGARPAGFLGGRTEGDRRPRRRVRDQPLGPLGGTGRVIEGTRPAGLEALAEPAGARPLRRARVGVTAIFFANGLAIGAWAVAIPQVKALFALSDGGLSLILLAAGIGAIAAMPVAGLLPPRIGGTGRTLRLSGPFSAVVLAALPAMIALPAPAVALAVCAFLFGVANILVDVPMNAHASVIERGWGRAIMSSFHAAWSAGGLIGSAIGGGLIALGASPFVQLGAEGALCFGLAAWGASGIGVGDRQAHKVAFAIPHGRLVALSIIALLAVFAEMSVTDWSALYLKSGLGASAGVASAGYAAYALMMFLGRALGTRWCAGTACASSSWAARWSFSPAQAWPSASRPRSPPSSASA